MNVNSVSKITPFDAETILMIENVIGMEPIVKEGETEYCIVIPRVKNNTELENAIAGRLGKRLITCNETELNATFRVEYHKDAETLPIQQGNGERFQPNPFAGNTYCRRLLEVVAMQVRRDNVDKLEQFTGGGLLTIPRCPGGTATYQFATENGTFIDVPEDWFIIRGKDGKFAKMRPEAFKQVYEPKFGETQQLFNDSFGTNILPRCRKLTEEYNELMEVVRNADAIDDKEFVKEFIDELADVNAVVFHIAGILGYSQNDLLAMATDKVKGRKENPEYKRTHPHKPKDNKTFRAALTDLINRHSMEKYYNDTPDYILADVAVNAMGYFADSCRCRDEWHGFKKADKVCKGSECCGNCNHFSAPDPEGDGYCDKQDRMRHTSVLACNEWENGLSDGKGE